MIHLLYVSVSSHLGLPILFKEHSPTFIYSLMKVGKLSILYERYASEDLTVSSKEKRLEPRMKIHRCSFSFVFDPS